MVLSIMLLRYVLLTLLALPPCLGAEKLLVIGDSLSKEYAIEFPLLNPGNPAAWGERNWVELLSLHRGDLIDIGQEGAWPDSRITGHEYNWAFPGSTTSEWEEILTSSFFEAPQNVLLRTNLDAHLDGVVDRAVIFLGGNDLKNNYGTFYDGKDPANFINKLVANVREIVDYVQDRDADLPIVLVNMPDVGITPVVQQEKPDAAKRQLVTDLTDAVNERLKTLAEQRGIGYADIEQWTALLTGPERFVVGGIQFFKSVDPESLSNRPQYLFSPDGFHPNTMAQLLFANEIVEAFARTYPDLTIVPPFSTEEMLTVLELEPDVSFTEWAEAYGITSAEPTDDGDGDGVPLYQEFAFDLDPRIADADRGPSPIITGERLEIHYPTRVRDSAHFEITPQFGIDLENWQPVPPEQHQMGVDGRYQAWVAPHGDRCFLRLTVTDS